MTEKLHHIAEERQPKRWSKLRRDTQEALLEWYNRRAEDVTPDDLDMLADLRFGGLFRYWNCPSCSELVMEGEPKDWSDFQGVRQNDRTSYPGKSLGDRRCDHCRCYDKN